MTITFSENDKVILEKSGNVWEDKYPNGDRMLLDSLWDLPTILNEVENIINDKKEI